MRKVHHGEIFQNALFDFFHAEMVGVENLPRLFHVFVVLGVNRPFERAKPVDVTSGHVGVRRAGAHFHEAAEFFLRLFGNLFRHAAVFDFFLINGVFVFVFAEFVADGAHLLAQIIFLLVFVYAVFHLLRNDLVYFSQFRFVGEQRAKFEKALFGVGFFKQALFLGVAQSELQSQPGSENVGVAVKLRQSFRHAFA